MMEAHPGLQRRKVVLINLCIQINLFELFVNFTNMYWLMCDMQSQKMRKFDKFLTNLCQEECKTLLERLQRDESYE